MYVLGSVKQAEKKLHDLELFLEEKPKAAEALFL